MGVNTLPGNVQQAMGGTYRVAPAGHDLAELAHCFNRHWQLVDFAHRLA